MGRGRVWEVRRGYGKEGWGSVCVLCWCRVGVGVGAGKGVGIGWGVIRLGGGVRVGFGVAFDSGLE